MNQDNTIPYLSRNSITDKIVLLRCDFDVTLDSKHRITNDYRITCNSATIEYLLKGNNTIVLLAKRGDPINNDPDLSLAPLAPILPKYLPEKTLLTFFPMHPFALSRSLFSHAQPREIFLLENVRFWKEEKQQDEVYIRHLAGLADVYVNDCFAISHRTEATVTGLPQYMPSFAGIHLEKELSVLTQNMHTPKHPVVSIVGGAKISKKIRLLYKLIDISDSLILGGALANTFLAAQGNDVQQSLYEKESVQTAGEILVYAKRKGKTVYLPIDVGVSLSTTDSLQLYPVAHIPTGGVVKDIGNQTLQIYTKVIQQAQTIIWNGPMGQTEEEKSRKGTTNILKAIVSNKNATSLIGGGDTINALGHDKDLQRITFISTGGGAMLEFIEKGDLVGLKALREGKF